MGKGIIGKLLVKLGLDNSEYKTKLTESQRQAEKFSQNSTKAVRGLQGAFTRLAGVVSIGATIKKAFTFAKDAYMAAEEVKGVRRAFDRLNDPSLLYELKEATSGAVDDLKLMQMAVQAKNFKLPLDQVATYLKFATIRAQETGESVDYLVNSIITGLGRESLLILDNLGISITKVRQEMEGTGDMVAAVGRIIERSMSESADAIETGTLKSQRLKAAWSNLKREIGDTGVFQRAGEAIMNFMGAALESLVDMFTFAGKSSAQNKISSILGNSAASDIDKINALNSEMAFLDYQIKNHIARKKELESQSYVGPKDFKELQDINKHLESLEGRRNLYNQARTPLQYTATAQELAKRLSIEAKSVEELQTLKKRYVLSQDPVEKQLTSIITGEINKRLQAEEAATAQAKQLAEEQAEAAKRAAEDAYKQTFAYKEKEIKASISSLESQKREYGATIIYMEEMLRLRKEQLSYARTDQERERIRASNEELEKQIELLKGISEAKTIDFEAGSEADLAKQLQEVEVKISKINTTTEDGRSKFAELTSQADKLRQTIAQLPQNILFEAGSEADISSRINDINTALKNTNTTTDEGKRLAAEYTEELKRLDIVLKGLAEGVDLSSVITGLNAMGMGGLVTPILESWSAAVDQYAAEQQRIMELNDAFNSIIQNGVISSLIGVGEAMGAILSGNNEEVWQALLIPIADVAIQLGELAIATGIALLAIKASFKSLGGAGAIAAGIALVALGNAVKGALSNMASSMGGGGVGGGNTFTGGYSNSGALYTPPLYDAPTGGGELTTRVSGDDLEIVLGRNQNRKGL